MAAASSSTVSTVKNAKTGICRTVTTGHRNAVPCVTVFANLVDGLDVEVSR
jgi:hypothetical protein